MRPWMLWAMVGALAAAVPAAAAAMPLAFANPAGETRTYSTRGPLDPDTLFFQPLGPAGRSCATCHVPADGWSLTPATARALFDATDGRHPLFDAADAASAPGLPTDTLPARRAAYRLLLERGLIRVARPIPPGAGFVLEAVDDPYGHAGAGELSPSGGRCPSPTCASWPP